MYERTCTMLCCTVWIVCLCQVEVHHVYERTCMALFCTIFRLHRNRSRCTSHWLVGFLMLIILTNSFWYFYAFGLATGKTSDLYKSLFGVTPTSRPVNNSQKLIRLIIQVVIWLYRSANLPYVRAIYLVRLRTCEPVCSLHGVHSLLWIVHESVPAWEVSWPEEMWNSNIL